MSAASASSGEVEAGSPKEDAPTHDHSAISDAEADALFAEFAAEPALVLAVSGGPDSIALMLLAARWRARRKRGPDLLAVTVDHGLRPESRREAAAVKALAKRLGIAHRTLRWAGAKPRSGVQERARAARYALLAQAARRAGARVIATAHTRDDQAETVLFRMARGSGLTGLAGMARARSLPQGKSGAADLTLARPLLDVAKARLVATLARDAIASADDPSNRDPRFTRVRFRALMPALAREGLDARRLAALARRIGRADRAIETVVDAASARLAPPPWPPRGPVTIEAAAFATLPAEVALRLIGRAIAAVGNEGPVELGKLEHLAAALAAALDHPGRFRRTLAGAAVSLGRGSLTVERAPARRTRPGSGKGR